MTAQSVLDAVRRVEEAPLADLVGVSVDDVEAQMDHLLEPEIDTASLYRRWERQQWAVSDLDFSADVQHWQNLPANIRQVMQNTMTLFFIGEQAVTDTLAPLLHAAPYEDERIFLATQIATRPGTPCSFNDSSRTCWKSVEACTRRSRRLGRVLPRASERSSSSSSSMRWT